MGTTVSITPELHGLTGFDPLAPAEKGNGGTATLFENATKREVTNILKSYTGAFDIFSELIQNSLDALERRWRIEKDFKPKILIEINIKDRTVRCADNGSGMTLDEIRYCFTPHVSFKKDAKLRGNKGVGATFLAYGFSSISIQSKKEAFTCGARLRLGRQWAEDQSDSVERPKYEEFKFASDFLEAERSGTDIRIVIGAGQRPDLTYYNARTANQWLQILRIKTPLGGIYLSSPPFSAEVKVNVADVAGDQTREVGTNIQYLWPHELPNLPKVQSTRDIDRAVDSISGDPQTKFQRLPVEFRRLDAVYEIWSSNDILSESSPFRLSLNEQERELIERHQVSIYGCFLSTAKSWSMFNDEYLKIRKGSNFLRGGLQLASDFMPQGDLRVIPLTSTIGYQANSHIIIHFIEGSPDMGRKVFQPELTELADELSRRAVTHFRKYLNLMRPDTGAAPSGASGAVFKWKTEQMKFREEYPLNVGPRGKNIALLSQLQQEQDVIALYHEMLGAGIIRGLRFLATSQSDRYDGLFLYSYTSDELFDEQTNLLGVNANLIAPGESEPKVLEYKFSLDGLVSDMAKEQKFSSDIDLCICWETGNLWREHYTLEPFLVGDEGSNREIFGSTHAMMLSHQKLMEVVVLRDLLDWIADPVAARAKQKTTYS